VHTCRNFFYLQNYETDSSENVGNCLTTHTFSYPEDGGNRFLRNVGIFLPNYTLFHPKMEEVSYTKSWFPFTKLRSTLRGRNCFPHLLRNLSLLRPLLCSSDQSSWVQIQRCQVGFPALPDFLRSSGSGTGSTQPPENN
jgi:hypothetical protein